MASSRQPSIYCDPLHYDLIADMTAPRDLPFYLRHVEDRGGPVLELGCGTGRICLPIAGLGVATTGVDVAGALLERARQRAAISKLGITLVEADLRELELGEAFALVLMPYNVLNHMLDAGSIEASLAASRRHMTATSRLLIDTFNPDAQALRDDEEKPILRYVDPFVKAPVIMTEQNSYSAASQVNTVTWRYAIGSRQVREDRLQMRVFFPEELDALLPRHGLIIEDKLGDYDGSPFRPQSSKQLLICRRA